MARSVAAALAGCLAVCLAACGFQGETPFQEALAPSLAPWDDLGPVTVCQGSARIGPPGSMPGGFCVDAAPAPAPCESDADCGRRERCTCGGCRVALCLTAEDCRADQICNFIDHRCDRSCRSDADCGAGEVCPAGDQVCRGRCATTADCQRGEVCDSGLCEVAQGRSGGPCQSDADCGGGHPVCALQSIPAELREPAPFVDASGTLVLFLERVDGTRSAVWRAVEDPAPDGQRGLRFHFDPAAPVVSPDASDGGRAGAPTVATTAAGLLLVYADAAGHLRSARSADGVRFTTDPAPLDAAGWFGAASPDPGLDGPSLARLALPGTSGDFAQGQLLLYYATADRGAVGLATSSDGASFTPAAAPVLTTASVTDPAEWHDLTALASPQAFVTASPDGDPVVQLVFSAHGIESGPSGSFGAQVPPVPNDSIGAASSLDGAAFTLWPWNPVLDRVINFARHGAEDQPAVVPLDGSRLLYYVAADADGTHLQNLRVARNP